MTWFQVGDVVLFRDSYPTGFEYPPGQVVIRGIWQGVSYTVEYLTPPEPRCAGPFGASVSELFPLVEGSPSEYSSVCIDGTTYVIKEDATGKVVLETVGIPNQEEGK